MAEKEVKLKQHIAIHRQLWYLAVLQRNHRLRSQRGAGHACSRTVPADTTQAFVNIIEL